MLVPLLTALHVITIILWIGGVAFVTMIIFPTLKMEDGFEKVMMFPRVENTFARHARYYPWTTAISGSILLYITGQYTQLFTRSTVGVSVMIIVWTVYILVLTLEKKIFGIIFRYKNLDPSKIFLRLSIFHWVVLSLSLFAVFAGVWTGGRAGAFQGKGSTATPKSRKKLSSQYSPSWGEGEKSGQLKKQPFSGRKVRYSLASRT